MVWPWFDHGLIMVLVCFQSDCEKEEDQSWLNMVKKQGSLWSTMIAAPHKFERKNKDTPARTPNVVFLGFFKLIKGFLAFSLTKGIPTDEQIAVQNICMRSTTRLGELFSKKTPSNKHKLNFTTIWIENADTWLADIQCKLDPKPQKPVAKPSF